MGRGYVGGRIWGVGVEGGMRNVGNGKEQREAKSKTRGRRSKGKMIAKEEVEAKKRTLKKKAERKK